MSKYLFICILALTGCVTSQFEASQASCEQLPSWVKYARCLNAIGTYYYPKNSYEREAIAYRNVLIEKVEAKEISEVEAEYLRQRQWSSLKQAMNAVNKNNPNKYRRVSQSELLMPKVGYITTSEQPITTITRPSYEIKNPERTECRPNRLSGGFDCTTY